MYVDRSYLTSKRITKQRTRMCHSCPNLVRTVPNFSTTATLALALTDIRHRSYLLSHISSVFTHSDNKNRPPDNFCSINRGVALKLLQHDHYSTYSWGEKQLRTRKNHTAHINPYPTAFPYGNGMVLHFYQQQESSTTKTVHKVINKRLKTYV